MIEPWMLQAVAATVLLHAAYRDYRTGYITNLHLYTVLFLSILYTILSGTIIVAAVSIVLFTLIGGVLYWTGKWHTGDVYVLALLGLLVHPHIQLFMYTLLVTDLVYRAVWKWRRGEHCHEIPGITASYIVFLCLLYLTNGVL